VPKENLNKENQRLGFFKLDWAIQFYTARGKIVNNSKDFSYGTGIKIGDIVTCKVNRKNGSVSFSING